MNAVVRGVQWNWNGTVMAGSSPRRFIRGATECCAIDQSLGGKTVGIRRGRGSGVWFRMIRWWSDGRGKYVVDNGRKSGRYQGEGGGGQGIGCRYGGWEETWVAAVRAKDSRTQRRQ